MLATVPITLIRRTEAGTDALGKPTYTEAESTVQGIYAPGASSEQTQGMAQVVVQPTIYIADVPSPPLKTVDRVVVLGQPYEVDGEPLDWPANPFSGWRPEFPVEVRLKKVSA